MVTTDRTQMEAHILNHFQILFNQNAILQDNGIIEKLIEETIPTLVSIKPIIYSPISH